MSDKFVSELKNASLQIAFEAFRNKTVEVDGKREYCDLYVMDRVFPVLFDGLEQLSRETENYIENKEKINIEERRRFNPCLFLA